MVLNRARHSSSATERVRVAAGEQASAPFKGSRHLKNRQFSDFLLALSEAKG